MFARFLLVTVLLLSVVTSTRQVLAKKPTPQTSAEVLALTHANVIDGVSAQPLRDATVIVRADRYDRRVITSESPWESHGSERRDLRLPATTANRRALVPHRASVCRSSSVRLP